MNNLVIARVSKTNLLNNAFSVFQDSSKQKQTTIMTSQTLYLGQKQISDSEGHPVGMRV